MCPEPDTMDMEGNDNATQNEVHDNGCDQGTMKPTKRKYTHSANWHSSHRHKSHGYVQYEHKCRTRRLLRALVRQHNWKQASGVLSVLLQGTCRERFATNNREKYRVAMELLNKVPSDNIKLTKMKKIYEVWIRKNRQKDKYSVELELALFFFLRGNVEEATGIIKSLMSEGDHKNDPVLNMMAGLIYYELWYASLPEEVKLRTFDIYETPLLSEILGMESYNQVEYPDGQDEENLAQYDSESSVGNYKELSTKSSGDMLIKHSNLGFKPQRWGVPESAEMTGNEEAPFHNPNSNMMNASIFKSCGLDANLLPIRLPHLNEEDFFDLYMKNLYRNFDEQDQELVFNEIYEKAKHYLWTALHSTPPVLESLLPFMQLLLLGDRVQEARNELDDLCNNSNAVLPLRLRAILLECFDSKQTSVLSTCYEDVLKKDPTCNNSLTRLITMHKNGDYDLESLTEIIALHLDATYAACSIWEEFASCFLKFSQLEDDQMSVNVNVDEGVGNRCHASFNTAPLTFIWGKSRNSWKLRCRWWSTRHFSKNAHISEMQAGDMQLSTMKAACASHLYGSEFEYVASVRSYLEEQDDDSGMLFLELHMKNSLNVFQHLDSGKPTPISNKARMESQNSRDPDIREPMQGETWTA